MGTISKINNKKGISYRAQIRKFQHGKLIYSEAKTFTKKPLAERWLAIRESELDSPESVVRAKNNTVLVSDLIHRYLHDFCHSAGRTKKKDIQCLLKYPFANLPISRLTSDVLISHIAERLHTVQPQTAQNDLIWLRNIFKAAQPAWGIPVNAYQIDSALSFCRSKGMVHRANVRDRRPSESELERLSHYFKLRDLRSDIPMDDIMWFAIHSARRESEITRLRWEDNRDQTGLVRDIKHPRKKGLNKRFRYTQEGWDIVQRQPRVSEFIFPYQPKSISAAFTRACQMLEIGDLRFHDLRHEATSRLFEAGYSIVEVQLFTLHESWAVLKRYVNLRPEDVALR